MVKGQQKTADSPSAPLDEQRGAERHVHTDAEEDCRCKDVSRMTVPELFKLMVSDLAFWKKDKKP